MAAHSDKLAFTCKKCDYQTNNKFYLRQHVKGIHLKIKDISCDLCDFQTSYNSVLKRHMIKFHVVKIDLKQDLAYKECYVKLDPLDPSLLVEAFSAHPNEIVEKGESMGEVKSDLKIASTCTLPPNAIIKNEQSMAAITAEGVNDGQKETACIEVKRERGEITTLSLLNQHWAKAEEKYKDVQENLFTLQLCDELNIKCYICLFQAGSKVNLAKHLLIYHVFDLE